MERPMPDWSKQATAWLMQEKHKTWAHDCRRKLNHAFTHHPEQTGETYLEHLWFTVGMALRFGYVSFIILTHGLFPFLFTRTASLQIEKLYLVMKSRIPKARLEEIDASFDI